MLWYEGRRKRWGAGGKAPGCLADPGAGRGVRAEGRAAGAEYEWVGGNEGDFFSWDEVATDSRRERVDECAWFTCSSRIAGSRDDRHVVAGVVAECVVHRFALLVGDAVLSADLACGAERDDAAF
jgi:hypothetical protein